MVSRCAARLLFRARLHAVYPGDAATRRIARTGPGDPLLAHRPASCRARLRQARSRRAAAPELLAPVLPPYATATENYSGLTVF